MSIPSGSISLSPLHAQIKWVLDSVRPPCITLIAVLLTMIVVMMDFQEEDFFDITGRAVFSVSNIQFTTRPFFILCQVSFSYCIFTFTCNFVVCGVCWPDSSRERLYKAKQLPLKKLFIRR